MKCTTGSLVGMVLWQAFCTVLRAAPDPLETWTWRNPLPQGSELLGVAYGDGQFVAVGPNGTIVTSTDAVHWVSQSRRTIEDLDAIAWGGGLFVAVGRNGTILSSPDGRTWTDHTLNPFHQFSAITYGNHRFVAVGEKIIESDVNLATSDDGLNWTAGTIDAAYPFTGVTYANGLFVAVGSDPWSNGNIATSPDGLTWTSQDTVGVTTVAYGNGRYVAVGGDNYHAGPNVLISTNGMDWHSQSVPGTRNAVTFGNGRFVATDGNFDTIVHVSADGMNWETHGFPSVEFPQAITFGAGQFVAVGLYGTILSSTDAVDWTLRLERAGPLQSLRGIVTDGTRMVAVAWGGGSLVSTNGIDWSYHPPPGTPFRYSINGVARGAGRIVAVGATNYYDPSTWRAVVDFSEDGASWTHEELTDSGTLRAVAFGIGQFVAVGEGSPSLLLTSTDGVAWNRQATPGSFPALNSVAFGNGRFVSVGNGGRILTATNAVEWADVSPPGFSKDLTGVAYGNGTFVAVGKYAFAVSSDGLNWDTNSSPFPVTTDFSGVDFAGGVFLARSTYGGAFTSEDGFKWTSRPWVLYFGSGRIVEFRGTLFSVGDGGVVLQSGPLSRGAAFSVPRLAGDGSFEFTIRGSLGEALGIETSGDLAHWLPLTTVSLTNTIQVFQDSAADPRLRYYRAVTLSRPTITSP